MADFWDQKCPERGTALKHRHANDCQTEHGNHFEDECCHCRMRASTAALFEAPKPAEPSEPPTHDYRFTVTGLCAVTGCGKRESEHPQKLAKPEAGCDVDHRSLTAKRLIADGEGDPEAIAPGGETWSQCPRCGVRLEPKFISGTGPAGPTWGKGRGVLTARAQRQMEFIYQRFYVQGEVA